MLRFLSIHNLAVIEAVELECEPGLTVLTGETGAGKSMLVEAVGLLLGGRATPDLIRTGEATATVQAIFDDSSGEELAVRREISVSGRSRAFINGALATSAALKELAERLVDLHGQHEHQALLDPGTHLSVLDQHAGLTSACNEVGAAYEAMAQATRALERARGDEAQQSARRELAAFQLAEIERAKLQAGEDEALASRRRLLASAEKVQRLCSESYGLLYDSDGAALANLSQVWKRVEELAGVEPRFQPYLEARDVIASQLDDLATFLRDYGADVDASPARLQEVEDRLALVERLKRKYGQTLSGVLATRDRLREELAQLESLADRAAALEADAESARTRFLALAERLSAVRRHAAPVFARALEHQLGELALERCRFEVRFSEGPLPPARWGAQGVDEAEFFVSPNPGEAPRPLSRIVSGGELSRIMLALKTLACTDEPGKTLIFDEVDAGIGGRVADAVGSKLKRLGERFQVLCITHLPQIAAHGSAHVVITKRVRQGRTLTEVARLNRDGRVEELARMLAGAAVSERARLTATEMLAARSPETGERRAKGESERVKAKGGRPAG